MGQTKLNPLFENISGALTKPKKKDGHKCGEYVMTKSEYWQKADTSVVIQTKTIETYDASKKLY